MTTYAMRDASPARTRADAVVVGVLAGTGTGAPPRLGDGAADVVAAYGRRLAPLLAGLGVTGKQGEVTRIPTGDALASPLLVLVGLGAEVSPGAVRRAAGVAARSVGNAASVALALPADTGDLLTAVVEGFLLGGYAFTRYQTSRTERPAEVVVLTATARRSEARDAFAAAQVVAEAVAATRDWVNTAAGDLTPPVFAEEVLAAVKAHGKGRSRGATKVTATCLDEERLRELGCGGLLAVGSGSATEPRLVELRYAPKDAVTHLALVGKGITYDSGGLTIKPGAAMRTMKSDMAGAAAVVQATLAVARLELPVRITAYAAMAENMLGGAAMRPGDVVSIHGGTTVEISNTDAEGRLVLADALVLATEEEPDLVVDVATLTGHMVVALGDQISGVLGSESVVDQVLAAAATAGEEFWPMPIPEVMIERIHSSTVADLAQHDWVRWGGGLFAAAFLREFTGALPWAHLDIAGPSFVSGGATGHLTPGGTGVGVTTLVELCRRLAEQQTG